MASRLQDVIQRGLASAKPAATTVAPGTLYFSSDTGVLERSDGSAWASYSAASGVGANTRAIAFTFDGQGSAIAANSKIYAYVPYGFTITDATIVADAAGSITFDVWMAALASYPPTIANTIIGGGTKPQLASADHAGGLALTGWTTTFAGARAVIVNVDSCAVIKKAQLVLTVTVL